MTTILNYKKDKTTRRTPMSKVKGASISLLAHTNMENNISNDADPLVF